MSKMTPFSAICELAIILLNSLNIEITFVLNFSNICDVAERSHEAMESARMALPGLRLWRFFRLKVSASATTVKTSSIYVGPF